ncbi:MAG: hypothetical protein Q9162_004459 [Coniocarpon cinnabarinum]
MSLDLRLYAEVLLNIRSVSVVAQATSSHPEEHTVVLSASDRQIFAVLDNLTASFELPYTINKVFKSSKVVSLSNSPQSIEARLPLDLNTVTRPSGESEDALWSASSLNSDSCFHCRQCHSMIVSSEALKQWKDLPSEGWAEMMDFWHCHKPPLPNGATFHQTSHAKGYAAHNRIQSQQGVGLINASNILVHHDDCQALEVSDTALTCANCHASVGDAIDATSYRLHKHALAVASLTERQPTSPPLEHWLSAAILTTIDAFACRRLLFYPPQLSSTRPSQSSPQSNPFGANTPQTLLLWIITPNLYIASAHASRHKTVDATALADATTHSTTTAESPPLEKTTPFPAMKILHRSLTPQKATEASRKSDIEELELPELLATELMLRLEMNRASMPDYAKKMGEWHVSFGAAPLAFEKPLRLNRTRTRRRRTPPSPSSPNLLPQEIKTTPLSTMKIFHRLLSASEATKASKNPTSKRMNFHHL